MHHSPMPIRWSVLPPQRGEPTTPDLAVARLAAGQWSIVDLADLRACGMSPKAIETRVARGILHPLYRGVFAWGHPNIPMEGHFLAAVKACGRYAVLSHYSAAALHVLVNWDGRPFEITARSKHSHPRINAHRSADVERMLIKGIPVTPKLRTVVDLARVERDDVVKRALRAAKVQRRRARAAPAQDPGAGCRPHTQPARGQRL